MITRKIIGCVNGQEVTELRLTNADGVRLDLMSYGARISRLFLPDRNGISADVVLGFECLDRYVASNAYHGAVCGRFGNRISCAKFELGGREWQLSKNDGTNHLHGGNIGFDQKVWQVVECTESNSVVFKTGSGHLEEGYPGNLTVAVTYTLTNDNVLDITLAADTDQATVVSLINHTYWNLGGPSENTVLDHELVINSDFYLPTNQDLIPTGEIRSVYGTMFDFRQKKYIRSGVENPDPERRPYKDIPANLDGFDNTWLLSSDKQLRLAAHLVHRESGRAFLLSTTEPSLQMYTASYLDEAIAGKSGVPYGRLAGITLEPQAAPDAPNQRHFTPAVVTPERGYVSRQTYKFLVE